MKKIVGACAFVGAMALSSSAWASPVSNYTNGTFQLDLQLGLGVATDDIEPIPDPYGFGVGGRLGWTIGLGPVGLYLGGQVNYFLGSSEDIEGFDASVSYNMLLIQPVIGVDIGLGPIVLRPHLDIGLSSLVVSSDAAGATTADSQDSGTITPGINALYKVAGPLTVGADLRYNLNIGQSEFGPIPPNGVILMANVGLVF